MRIRTAAIGGLVEDNPLASGAVTLTSAGLSALPLFAAGDFAMVLFDPNGRTGEPFAKRITAHAVNANTATIEATALYGTARSIAQGVPWRLTDILDQDGNGAGLLAVTKYMPGTDQLVSITATTATVVDATNLKVSFVAPPSGKVLYQSTIEAFHDTAGGWGGIALVDATNTLIAGSKKRVFYSPTSSTVAAQPLHQFMETGITPGTTYERRLAAFVDTGRISLEYGPSAGDVTMAVWAVNV